MNAVASPLVNHRAAGRHGTVRTPIRHIDLARAGALIHDAWRSGGTHLPCSTGMTRDLRDSWAVHPESFTAMLVADLLMGLREHNSLVAGILGMLEDELSHDGLFYFFKDHKQLPADADCTALGLSVLLRGGAPVTERAHRGLDRIVANTNSDGVIETYFDATGERSGIVDPVVCVNALYLAYRLGREAEVEPTLEYVRQVLVERSFTKGTRYYHSPDTFLYFAARLVRRFPVLHGKLLKPLREALVERQGATEFPLDVAQRVIAARWLRVPSNESVRLVELQDADGCWPADSLFRYGRKRIYFGSRALTAAFALCAIRDVETDALPLDTRLAPRLVPNTQRLELVAASVAG